MEIEKAVENFKASTNQGISAELKEIGHYFNLGSHDLILKHSHYTYNIDTLMNNLSRLCENAPIFRNDILPTIAIQICDALILKIVFSAENDVIYILAHAVTELERSELLQSEHQFAKALSVYFGKVFDWFQDQYDEKGIYKFVQWAHYYKDLHTKSCKKCGELMIVDSFGAFVPPVIRDPTNGEAYHVCCAPVFEGLEHLGFAVKKTE
ncbi:hypothetical protein TVAG_247040 [Trichomonas vaginalis G3]|uniref:Uncharacterized protein n=1 Tax=Trichomonas vaginalis (strain ATCC PRA-98 / G3) TaxID=412133 RepID=A2DKP2_TRIV3|nr:34 kDa transcriptional co-activator-related family [Trichomonas vaginalis G3]EAY19025.1 hypothetical protein TVAG_247040 [Trichomonas vaginalis G3]KAI5521181.1 34 kDa transcriptional co-activator-related family [Trichomonas vaginalis G3]|eukprot:XP_001580011.1 hypothetical protein [Trichomonas vaginalis G3]